ncbi:cell wall-binding repeat-containing protein [Clostridium sp.]|uniref:cell wall-binding repeat-containing protein n=1 Tax=Clostridium sp. TaxID=1506 RepID=UPI0032173B2C
MKQYKKIIAMILVFAMAFMQVPSIVAYAEEAVLPTIDISALKVDKNNVTVGDKVKVSFKISANRSDIKSIKLSYQRPIVGSSEFISMTYNSTEDSYEGYVDIDENSDCGVWKIISIALYDNNDNYIGIGNSNIQSNEKDTRDLSAGDFTVGGTNIIIPKIDLATLKVDKPNATIGDKVKISFKDLEDQCNIYQGLIFYRKPLSNDYQGVHMTYNPSEDTFEGYIDINKDTESGIWQIDSIDLDVNYGGLKYGSARIYNSNVTRNILEEDFSGGNFTVNGSATDVTPPVMDVSTLKVDKTRAKIGDKVNVSFKVTDNLSGVEEVLVMYLEPEKRDLKMIKAKYNATTDRYEGALELLSNFQSGVWKISAILLVDNDHNNSHIYNNKVNSDNQYGIMVDLSKGDFTLVGNTKPVISGAIAKNVTVGDSFDAKAGVTATDAEDGSITSQIAVSGTVDTKKVGKYTLTYTVTDSDGNKVSVSRIINVIARNVQVNALIGSDRYDTAVGLSKSQFTTANTVMIANGGALADGLAATPLATYKNAPLLLTEASSLPEGTKGEIRRLGAKNAIIIGGTSVVNGSVEKELKALGVTNIERIGGSDRYDTSLEIAKYIDKNCYDVNNVVISNGLGQADALSIASVAGRDKMAIVLVERDVVPTKVYSWLQSESLENAYIIGGTTVVSDNVLNKVDGITSANIANNRLGGKDRYATNAMVIEKFYGSVINKTYIAKGLQLIDALAAGPVAALNGSPVVLSGDDLTTEQKTVLGKRYGNIIVRTGGGISDKSVNSLKSCIQQ